MEFFDAVEFRRSIRRFTEERIPESTMRKAFEAAVLAPNSSNTQTWNFFWVKSPAERERLVKNCLGQSAARTAQELVVVTADPKLWKRSQRKLIDYVIKAKAPKSVLLYYEKVVPMAYRWGLFNLFAPFKWLLGNSVGLVRPMIRGPNTRRDAQEVAIKSSALAAENFVLALAAQGVQSCMMEGFDEFRVRRQLKLSCTERVVMVIGVGKEAERGTWGPRFRLPLESVLKEI